MKTPQTAGEGAAPVALTGTPTAAQRLAAGGGHPERAQVEQRELPGARAAEGGSSAAPTGSTSPRGGALVLPVQTSAALAVGGPASGTEGAGKNSVPLANLAEYWDQLAADQQGISDLYADSDPAQSHIARGRARQLTDCADQLRQTLAALEDA